MHAFSVFKTFKTLFKNYIITMKTLNCLLFGKKLKNRIKCFFGTSPTLLKNVFRNDAVEVRIAINLNGIRTFVPRVVLSLLTYLSVRLFWLQHDYNLAMKSSYGCHYSLDTSLIFVIIIYHSHYTERYFSANLSNVVKKCNQENIYKIFKFEF